MAIDGTWVEPQKPRKSTRNTLLGLVFRSITTKLIMMAVIFAVVPVILYMQFRAAYEDRQNLLQQSVAQQGRLIARSIAPLLEPGEGGQADNLPVRLHETITRLANEEITVRVLLRPVNVIGVKGFYYVAAAPEVSADFLERERSEFIRLGILERLAPACDGGIEKGLRYRNADGSDEIVTSMLPMNTSAGCWILVTSHSAQIFPDFTIGQPYWRTPEMKTAAVIYGIMVIATFSLFGGVWRSLRRFGDLAEDIGSVKDKSLSFQSQNRIVELTGVAREFDAMVGKLQKSALSIRRAAEDNAHAFKTPIAVMRQCLEPLDRAVPADDKRGRRALEVLDKATDRLDGLVSVARRMDEAEAELINPPRDTVNMSKILNRLLAGYKELTDRRSISLQVQIAPGVKIQGGEDLIETVVENLMENALSFTPGQGRIRVMLGASRTSAVLLVDDTGPGISELDTDKIFDRYYSMRSADTEKNEAGHMGIGLWIVRRNLQAIGGSIKAENRRQGGARMIVTVPLAR